MNKSSSKFSYDNTLGAGHDQSSEAGTEIIRPPEIDPLISNATVLPPKLKVFLAGFDPSEAKVLRDSALHIFNNEKQGIIGRIDTGLKLIARKRGLGHGRYMEYISSLEISEKYAERCSNVARHFSRYRDLVSGVAWSALYELAAKGVPDEVREEVIAHLKAGEYLTRKDIKSLIESASSAMCRSMTKTNHPGLPQSPESASKKRPDFLEVTPDRSRAVALLAHSGSSLTSEPQAVSFTMSDVQPSGEQVLGTNLPTVGALALLPAPQPKTAPSEEQLEIPPVMQGDLPALASLIQPDEGNSGDLIEKATSASDSHVSGDQGSGAALAAVKMVGVLRDKLTREEGRELYRCMKHRGGELLYLLSQCYGTLEADA